MDNGNETLLFPSYRVEMNKTQTTSSTYSLHKTLPPSFSKLCVLLFPLYSSNWKPYGVQSLEQGDFLLCYIVCNGSYEKFLCKSFELAADVIHNPPSLLPYWCDLFTQHIINPAATSRFLMNRTALEFGLPEWIVYFLLIFKYIST